MRILFVDAVTPKVYDPNVLLTQPLGGTEGTVIRIAEALSNAASVRVAQHCRTTTDAIGFGATYSSFGDNTGFAPTHVVVLRAPMALYQARKQFPEAKLYLWCHDMFGGEGWAQGFKAVQDTGAQMVLVSEWHKLQMLDYARTVGVQGVLPCRRIYNPIADDLAPIPLQEYNRDKVLFFSSPHKGLAHTLGVFDKFKNFKELENVKLYLANPGYFKDADTSQLDNVVNLGALPHHEVIAHVRTALCVLHLNDAFPETMGIVHAEANAVGTPFLSSRVGANPELADHPAELIDVRDTKAVVERVMEWRKGRPKVRGNENFRMRRVITQWLEMFNGN